MPLNAAKFYISQLKKVDSDGTPVNRWLKQGAKPLSFICTLCKTDDLCCGNKWWQSIGRPMHNKKHRDSLKLIKENSTFVVQAECEQPKKKCKLTVEPVLTQDENTYYH